VVIADDSVLIRRGIVTLLEQESIRVVGEAFDASSLLAHVAAERPDVAVVDIRMPPSHGDEGLVAAANIRAWFPTVAVLILSQYVRVDYALRMLEENAGSIGYLLKDRVADGSALVHALHRVAAGECVVDRAIVDRLHEGARAASVLEPLTPREREVLRLMAEGHANDGICTRLHLGPKTVETHVSHIFRKLDVEEQVGHRRVLAVLHQLRADGTQIGARPEAPRAGRGEEWPP
jgi:serine/threonine-protein kinase